MRQLALWVVVWIVSGCAAISSVSVDPHAALFDDAAFASQRVHIDPDRILAMTPEMTVHLAQSVPAAARLRGLRQGLVDALYDTGKLRLTYDAGDTKTAGEAFQAGSGNCLSLVLMTSAMAQSLGLEVRYQRVLSEDVWVRDGDLVHRVGHLNVSLGRGSTAAHRTSSPTDWLTIDFLPIDDAQRLRSQIVGEQRVLAMYMNNRAGEILASQRPAEAYWWARAAIGRDPGYASPYITLGAVWLAAADAVRAEAAFRTALLMAPDNPQALNNLATALWRQGRSSEAQSVQERLAQVESTTPMLQFKSGIRHFAASEFRQARDAFRNALRLAPQDPELHYMLALAHNRLGDRDAAGAVMRDAIRFSGEPKRRSIYESKLSTWAADPVAGSASMIRN